MKARKEKVIYAISQIANKIRQKKLFLPSSIKTSTRLNKSQGMVPSRTLVRRRTRRILTIRLCPNKCQDSLPPSQNLQLALNSRRRTLHNKAKSNRCSHLISWQHVQKTSSYPELMTSISTNNQWYLRVTKYSLLIGSKKTKYKFKR